MSDAHPRAAWPMVLVVFGFVTLASGLTVAGPGLTWDEPAYRGSEVRLQDWGRALGTASSASERWDLVREDAIDFYFEFNRFGPNFHPPLSSYGHLITWRIFGNAIDDLSARRLASSIELGLTAAMISYFLARRFGRMTGLVAGLGVGSFPRVFGDSHVAGTDIPLLCLWTLSALLFPSALKSRSRQWLLATALGLLFLVKFNGAMIVLPLGVAFGVYAMGKEVRPHLLGWLGSSLLLGLPLVPIASLLLSHRTGGAGPDNTWVDGLASHSRMVSALLLWPAIYLGLRRWIVGRRDFPMGLELPWRLLALAPLVSIGCNPTWWHDPVGSLARFFDLSLNRQGYLPDIEIFYLGQQYVYSLPWPNAWVLMGVTIPLGMLLLGWVGIGRGLTHRDPVMLYLMLQMVTLPVVRMFPVPAHDGVRLFLPTFAFWSALAAVGGWVLVQTLARRGWNHSWVWGAILLVGPGWGYLEIARWHPYELSYYNLGLPRARAWGFEVTYWYDAVTRPVLMDLNAKLPPNALLSLPSPRINPEVFLEHQSKGRLRPDLRFDVSKGDDFPFMLLLTHASKADPFTRLLYGVEPWYASRKDGVRLFSVIDPQGVALAWGLYFLSVDSTSSTPRWTNRFARWKEESLLQALDLIARHGASALSIPNGPDEQVLEILSAWVVDGAVHPSLARMLPHRQSAMEQAIRLFKRRGDDVRVLVETPGYAADEIFHAPLRLP